MHSSLVFFSFFFSSKLRSDIESVHVKRVVKKKKLTRREGRPVFFRLINFRINSEIDFVVVLFSFFYSATQPLYPGAKKEKNLFK